MIEHHLFERSVSFYITHSAIGDNFTEIAVTLRENFRSFPEKKSENNNYHSYVAYIYQCHTLFKVTCCICSEIYSEDNTDPLRKYTFLT